MIKNYFLILLGFLSTVSAAPNYSMRMVRFQAESPVQVVAVNSSTTYFLNGALLMNARDVPLEKVRLGFTIVDRASAKAVRTELSGTFEVYIPPKGTEAIWNFPWRTPKILYEVENVGVEAFDCLVEVVGATFSDGSIYFRDLPVLGPVPGNPDDPLASEIWMNMDSSAVDSFLSQAQERARVNHQTPSLRTYTPDPGSQESSLTIEEFSYSTSSSFCCATSTSMMSCSASQESCSMSLCGGSCAQYYSCPGAPCCPCQICDIAPCL